MTGQRAVRATIGSAVALAVVLGATGCTSGSSSKAASAAGTSAGLPRAGAAVSAAAGTGAGLPQAGAAVSAAAGTSAAAAAPSAGAPAAPTSAAPSAAANGGLLEGRPVFQADPTAGRSIIYTATVNVQVATAQLVLDKADEAERLAREAGGYVFSREGQAADNTPQTVPAGATPAPQGIAEADITIKVPPANYGSLLDRLEKLGTELSIEQHSQDVTDQVVDSQARLSSLKASVERVRTLLSKATTIGQIVNVEGELTKRESDLEAMEGKLNVLKAQAALATLTLHLQSAPPKPVVVPPKPKPVPKPKHPIHGFVGGLKAGGRGFATVAIAVATVVGAVLPFLGLLLVLALLAWWGRRVWQKNRRPAGPVEQASP
ncbi:MAG: hypothetical protein QOE24_1611 [Frankiales bacterium]|nr:hypothetical protein [Frankiales bacterium]